MWDLEVVKLRLDSECETGEVMGREIDLVRLQRWDTRRQISFTCLSQLLQYRLPVREGERESFVYTLSGTVMSSLLHGCTQVTVSVTAQHTHTHSHCRTDNNVGDAGWNQRLGRWLHHRWHQAWFGTRVCFGCSGCCCVWETYTDKWLTLQYELTPLLQEFM